MRFTEVDKKTKRRHYWITDQTLVIEFDKTNLKIHHIPHLTSQTERRFDKSEEVVERMKNVCGATNFSFALRNFRYST